MNQLKPCRTVLILIAALSIFLVGCEQTQTPAMPENQESKIAVPFRITWTDYSGRGVAIQKIVDAYNESNQGDYEMSMQSGDENLETISSILEVGTDLPVLVLPYRYVQFLGDSHLLRDLSADFKGEETLFYPALWRLGEVNDLVYGIPWVGHSICLIYNKNLLHKAGVDPKNITDLQSLVEALEQVEKNTSAKGIGLVGANHNDISWMVNQFIYGFGSGLVDETGTQVIINNDKSREALTFYRDVLGELAQPTWLDDTGVEVMEHFRKQEIAFEFQGVWGVTDIDMNGDPFEIGIIDLEDIGLRSEVGPLMLSIPVDMDEGRQEEAVRFIRYMISKEAQKEIMAGEYNPEHDVFYPFRVPTRLDLATDLVFTENPQYLPFLSGFKNPSVDVPVPKWQVIKDKYYAPDLSLLMRKELEIDTFLQLIETQGNLILSGKNTD